VKSKYVLIDYENIQPTDLALLQQGSFKIKVFLGPQQVKIPVALAAALQPFGKDAEYVFVETAGANALDFHIAYHLGVLSTQEPSASFHIVAKDSGYDPLIKHLAKRSVKLGRVTSIKDLVAGKPKSSSSAEERLELAVADLVRRKAARPRTRKSLINTLHALFRKELSEQQLSALFDALCRKGVVQQNGTRVSYILPTTS
jgi:hypothetical protein